MLFTDRICSYFVGGVNGVGKTTLLDAIAKTQPGFRVVKGSNVLMDYLGIPGDYEALRTLPQEEKIDQFGRCLEGIFSHQNENTLVDAHYLNLIRDEVYMATGEWLCHFNALVLVTAPTRQILGRIRRDRNRDRALFRVDRSLQERSLTDYKWKTLQEFQRQQEECAVPGLIISHQENGTAAAVQQFLEFHKEVQKTLQPA